jgi:hypothetical protein
MLAPGPSGHCEARRDAVTHGRRIAPPLHRHCEARSDAAIQDRRTARVALDRPAPTFHRHCEERSDAAIQGGRTGRAALDRHAAHQRLAMTATRQSKTATPPARCRDDRKGLTP